MQYAPDPEVKPVRVFRLFCGILIALACAFFLVVSLNSSNADRALEQRLLGKWAMWIEGTDLTLPTERFTEYLPDGQSTSYSADMVLLENPAGNKDQSHWRIQNGKFIGEMRHANGGYFREEHHLRWENDDTFISSHDVGNGNQVNVIHKRIRSRSE